MEVLLVLIVVVIGIFFYAKKVGFYYYDNKSNGEDKEDSGKHTQTFYTPMQVFETLGVEIVEHRENGGYIIAYQGG